MGNRADAIVDRLCKDGLISEKHANQPRTVIPQSVEDIPGKVMSLLTRHGKSVEDVAAALSNRNPKNAADHGEKYCHDNNC